MVHNILRIVFCCFLYYIFSRSAEVAHSPFTYPRNQKNSHLSFVRNCFLFGFEQTLRLTGKVMISPGNNNENSSQYFSCKINKRIRYFRKNQIFKKCLKLYVYFYIFKLKGRRLLQGAYSRYPRTVITTFCPDFSTFHFFFKMFQNTKIGQKLSEGLI